MRSLGLGRLFLCALAVLIGLAAYRQRADPEKKRIESRYRSFLTALQSQDDEAIAAHLAPGPYADAEPRLMWIRDCAGPVDDDWKVSIAGDKATVIPNAMVHWLYRMIPIPGGDGIHLVKVEGDWYFTGGIFID